MTGTNYQKTIAVITPELDEIFVALRDLRCVYRLDASKGKSLDNIGFILNFQRTVKETDAIYRDRLRDIIYINTITGTKLSIQKLLANYLRISESNVTIIEDVPNSIIIQLPTNCANMENELYTVIRKCVAAGVTVALEFSGTYWDEATWDNATYDWG